MPTVLADPQGRKGATVSTRFLRVPRQDWAAVTAGTKTELRFTGRGMFRFRDHELPLPVVAYSHVRYRAQADIVLLVVEAMRVEPLGSITPESLRAEGFQDLRSFKAYWNTRNTRKQYRPLVKVAVLTLRPWQPPDEDELARHIMRRLYGEWL